MLAYRANSLPLTAVLGLDIQAVLAVVQGRSLMLFHNSMILFLLFFGVRIMNALVF